MGKFLNSCLVTFTVLLFQHQSFGQSWMSNYSYRKKITIDKNKVSPITVRVQSNTIYYDLTDFPILIELIDPDLIHVPGNCGNKIRDMAGRDISVALSTAAASPLNFQLEHYDASTGKLRLWVKIPSLSANMSASAPTSVFLYYGSSVLHDPEGSSAKNTWTDNEYSRVWHMNLDDLPCISTDAKTQAPENRLTGSPGMGPEDANTTLLGSGIRFNGTTQYMTTGEEINTILTISAWIKLNATGQEQVIISNDTSGTFGTNGYTLKVNTNDNLVFEMRRATSAAFVSTGNIKLQRDKWYYVCATSNGKDNNLFVNGVTDLGRSGTLQRLGPGGSIRIGINKSGSLSFKGIVDELRIQKLPRTMPWLQTEYENQKNAADFYNISNEEYNPAERSRFTGALSSSWATSGNWQNGLIPASNSNVVVEAGKVLQIGAMQNFSCNSIILENGSLLLIEGKLKVNCTVEIKPMARISFGDNASLNCGGDVINHGNISMVQSRGSLIFSGSQPVQHFGGSGTTNIYRLENTQSRGTNVLLMNAPMLVSGAVKLSKGTLNSNGYLKLLANQQETASLLPILNTDSAAVAGIVHVQKYIDGDYPAPSTARGWKLLASPVYHSENQSGKSYTIAAIQNGMFVTGLGGVINGFDPSPLNSATIYTHDQSVSGKLSQKYVPIANTLANIPFGKGLCVFSRGDKNSANAYIEQIQNTPFLNPKGYILTHSGFIHTGNLSITLDNRNEGKDGDGFNLIGNPYPTTIRWGNLNKENLVDFVWLFDPLNNAYTVSDLPETHILSGSAFFVKIKNGFSNGAITFNETSKYFADTSIPPAPAAHIKTSVINVPGATNEVNTLTIELSKGIFKQHCKVKFLITGNDGLDDRDALKIDEGHVSIACLVKGQNLAINERSLSGEVLLYVKGWEAGKYQLALNGVEDFKGAAVFLLDKYLNQSLRLTGKNYLYEFIIDPAIKESYGSGRFSLQLQDQESDTGVEELTVYPNPFKDNLFLKTATNIEYTITLRDLFGRLIIRRKLKPGENILSGIDKIEKGLYILQVSDAMGIRHFKVLKE
ncbi:LamG-like jellyroll fold domain-containing protein [Pedobacter frigoris]|uniref:LamG-like jellyroll fold domain-containing protein n=1 Tax=Pedobacter frigoris TaxID=2571272 RepID=UPI0029311BAD|nr:LamG-like jellyroll fold domain-containing protein [Pedobacter frigoris]